MYFLTAICNTNCLLKPIVWGMSWLSAGQDVEKPALYPFILQTFVPTKPKINKSEFNFFKKRYIKAKRMKYFVITERLG